MLGLKHKPWVRKDPQLVFTWKHWCENVWNMVPLEDLPLVVMVLRYPMDWFNAIFARIDSGVWPGVPKDMAYFSGLWIDYATHMLDIAHRLDAEGRVFVTVLDHLCISEMQRRLSSVLGFPGREMTCFDVTKIVHSSGQQVEKLDEITGELWDKWRWLAVESEV